MVGKIVAAALKCMISVILAFSFSPLFYEQAFGAREPEAGDGYSSASLSRESTIDAIWVDGAEAPESADLANSNVVNGDLSNSSDAEMPIASCVDGDQASNEQESDTETSSSLFVSENEQENATASGFEEVNGFSLDSGAIVNGGVYVLQSAMNGRGVVEVAGGSREDCANVQLYQSNGTDAQRWMLELLDDGYCRLINVGSGYALEADSCPAVDGSNVYQRAWNGSLAQKWIPKFDGDSLTLRSALGDELVLAVDSDSAVNGANVCIQTINGSISQSFRLISCTPSGDSCENLGFEGWYEIHSSNDDGYVLEIAGGSVTNGANIQLYQSNHTLAQLFRFEYVDGWYLIQNALGGYLDVANADPVSGANVQAWFGDPGNSSRQWSIVCNPAGTFELKNRATGLMLDIAGGKVSNGVNIQAANSDGTSAQQFKIKTSTMLMPEGVYEILSSSSPRYALDVSEGSLYEGADVQFYSRNNTLAQKWHVAYADDKVNTYTIQSLASGLYLAMDEAGNIHQQGLSSSLAANWHPRIYKGAYVLQNAATGKLLTNGGNARVIGDGVQLYDEDAADASMLTLAKTELLPSGTYLVRSRVDISKVLDVENGAFVNCANVRIFTSNDTGAQKWNISKNSDGTYTFVNCRSKKALDVENGVAANGSNVQQYENNSTFAQKWIVGWNEKAGGYEFASALDPNYVLDLAGGSSIDGSNIQIYQRNGTAAQSFILTKASYVPTAEDLMLEKAQGYSSGTNYLILVNKGEHRVCVFSGYQNNWSLIQSWNCVVGKPSTPTPSGTFRTTGFKRPALTTDSRAIYCTQIHGGYFFHSILVSESELGNSLSHGCVRLPYSAANWIYTTIGAGTTVVIYG